MARILCISDLHCTEEKIHGNNINPALNSYISKDKFTMLISAIQQMGKIDMLILCGDYVFAKDSKETQDRALDKLNEFLEALKRSKGIFSSDHPEDRIIIVPGNHDIEREEKEILKRFKDLTKDYLTPFSEKNGRQDFPPIFVFDDIRVIVACESTVETGATHDPKIEELIKKIEPCSMASETKKELLDVLKEHKVYDIPSVSGQSFSDFMLLNAKIQELKKCDGYLKIMVSHHPLLDGIESVESLKKYRGTVGGYSLMKSAIGAGYRLFLHGHIHEMTCVEITDHMMTDSASSLQIGIPPLGMVGVAPQAILLETGLDDEGRFPFEVSRLKLSTISWKFQREGLFDNTWEKEGQRDGILLDYEIERIIRENKIVVDGDENNIQAASYDCALGYQYKKSPNRYCDWKKVPLVRIDSDDNAPAVITLKPRETALLFTYESFSVPDDMVMHASPISSWARRGLRVDLSYFVDPGFVGQFSFPVTNDSDSDISISSREPIVSIEFVQLSRKCKKRWTERNKKQYDNRRQMIE